LPILKFSSWRSGERCKGNDGNPATNEALAKKNVCLEINYVLENNDRMNNALLKLGVEPMRRYRVYEMAI